MNHIKKIFFGIINMPHTINGCQEIWRLYCGERVTGEWFLQRAQELGINIDTECDILDIYNEVQEADAFHRAQEVGIDFDEMVAPYGKTQFLYWELEIMIKEMGGLYRGGKFIEKASLGEPYNIQYLESIKNVQIPSMQI